MASLDIRRLGLGAMALIGASLVFKGVKGKEISKKEEDNLALEIGIDSVMGAEGDPHDAKNFDKWCQTCGSYDKNPTLPEGYCDECICVGCNETYSSGPSYAYCEICYEENYPDDGKDYDRSDYYAEGFDAESFEVETSSKGFLKENLPDSKEERLKDLKEDLEYRNLVLSRFKKLEASLMPFTTGMVGHLPKMEDKMLDFLYYVKQKIKHYTQLVAETQERMQQIKGAESFEAEA